MIEAGLTSPDYTNIQKSSTMNFFLLRSFRREALYRGAAKTALQGCKQAGGVFEVSTCSFVGKSLKSS